MVGSRLPDDPGLASVFVNVRWFAQRIWVLDLTRRVRQQNDPEPRVDQLHLFGGFQGDGVGPYLRALLLGANLLENVFRQLSQNYETRRFVTDPSGEFDPHVILHPNQQPTLVVR
jgi:hypothetical protein